MLYCGIQKYWIKRYSRHISILLIEIQVTGRVYNVFGNKPGVGNPQLTSRRFAALQKLEKRFGFCIKHRSFPYFFLKMIEEFSKPNEKWISVSIVEVCIIENIEKNMNFERIIVERRVFYHLIFICLKRIRSFCPGCWSLE